MQRMAKEWATEKKVKAALMKGLENVRRKRKEREAAKAARDVADAGGK